MTPTAAPPRKDRPPTPSLHVLRGEGPLRAELCGPGLLKVLARELALVLIFWIYGLGIPARYTLLRSLRREPRPAAAGLDDVFPR